MQTLKLIEHPEGGRFCEVFRSNATVTTASGLSRSALTHIYFSLNGGEVSRFHTVASDEVWNLYQGEGVRLHLWDEQEEVARCVELSAAAGAWCHVVPAGVWQAAEPLGEAVLVGCSVGPGFEFDDFRLIEPESSVAARMLAVDATLKRFVVR